jgi:hypothetical protein
MRILPVVFILIGTAIAALPAHSQQKGAADTIAKIKDVVQGCVQYVRNMPNPNPMYGDSYKYFDAYYNTATGQVENSAHLNLDQQAVYVFRKCMAEHNYPLK